MNDFGTGMHGVLGTDFCRKYKAVKNYEDFRFSFFNRKNFKDCVPLQSNHSNYTIIPPRCEVIKYISINCEECVVLAQEICKGVYSANVIVKPNNNRIPVRLLNTKIEK